MPVPTLLTSLMQNASTSLMQTASSRLAPLVWTAGTRLLARNKAGSRLLRRLDLARSEPRSKRKDGKKTDGERKMREWLRDHLPQQSPQPAPRAAAQSTICRPFLHCLPLRCLLLQPYFLLSFSTLQSNPIESCQTWIQSTSTNLTLSQSSQRNYRRLFPIASGSALAAASAHSSTPSTCGCACAGAGGRGAGGAQAAVPVVVARRLGGWRGDETDGFASGRRGWRVRCLLGSLVARVLVDGQARSVEVSGLIVLAD
ncbi:hypothetical protein JOL62DRAFT_181969 [Phyllosticta paracitricarpa]|uniref:Uncharacterized protein n=2 Tax=Phyllosticta TaxID=121621 RepID=A0ABR1M9I4_9PEZI